MMWKEFEQIAGYEVSYEDYTEIIEPMYMAIPDSFSKADFVKMIDKKRFARKTKAELKRAMRKEANHLAEICGHYTDWESEHRLEELAREYAKRFCGYDADDLHYFYYFEKEYEYTNMRGCSYPKTLIVGKGYNHIDEVILYA